MAGKLTLPNPPMLDAFKLSRSLARKVQETSRVLGVPAGWVVEQALESFTGSAGDDSGFRGDMRNNFVIDADDGRVCAVHGVERKGGAK